MIFHYLHLLNCEEKHTFWTIVLLRFEILHETLMIRTVTPGYRDAFKEDQEQQTHPTGRVVVEQFEHIESTLVAEKMSVIKRLLVQMQNNILWDCIRCH